MITHPCPSQEGILESYIFRVYFFNLTALPQSLLIRGGEIDLVNQKSHFYFVIKLVSYFLSMTASFDEMNI